MKTKLNYTVRSTRAPGEQTDTTVPVIVDRMQPIDLETVVENCIDRGLIAGLKTTAAHGIAEGVAAQIAREFSLGRGVQFGQFFYGRQYLSGTVDSNGRLTSANSVNVRLYKGNAFKLALGDFSWSFDGAGDAVKVTSIYGNTSDAGGNTYGQIVYDKPIVINGKNLNAAGDTNKVTFVEVGASSGATIEVSTFTAAGDGILSFAWPSGLDAGKSYSVTVSRTDPNGVTRTSAAKTVKVYGTAPAGDPPTVTSYLVDEMEGEPIDMNTSSVSIFGTNLATAQKVQFFYQDGTSPAATPFFEKDVTSSSDTSVVTGALGYTGSVSDTTGYFRVVNASGASDYVECTFSM